MFNNPLLVEKGDLIGEVIRTQMWRLNMNKILLSVKQQRNKQNIFIVMQNLKKRKQYYTVLARLQYDLKKIFNEHTWKYDWVLCVNHKCLFYMSMIKIQKDTVCNY